MSTIENQDTNGETPAIDVATAAGLFRLGSDQRVEFEGHAVDALARGSDSWWAIVDGREVWRAQAETGWNRVATSTDGRLNCLLATDHGVLVGTSGAHLRRLQEGGLQPVEGFEAAAGRDEWYTPWGGPPDIRSLSAAPSGTLYANVHVGGIVRSVDAGRSWTPTIDIHSDVHEVRAAGDGLVVAATARGLALSDDEGQTWRFDRAGLHASYARAVGLCDDTILLTVSNGPRAGRAAVYRRPIAAEGGLAKYEEGLPEWFTDNIDTGCLAASGVCAAIGTSDGQIFVSEDVGRTWRRIASGLPPVRNLVFG